MSSNSTEDKVLELRGDALLAEFNLAPDAVAASVAFQSNQDNYLSGLKDNLKPSIRVAIAMGEVVIGDGTVTGGGVVLAQRVEQLAAPGSFCINAVLHEALPNRMPFDLENIGEHKLKGSMIRCVFSVLHLVLEGRFHPHNKKISLNPQKGRGN